MNNKESEISQADHERRQLKAIVSPPRSLIDRFIKEANEEGRSESFIKYGVAKLIKDWQEKKLREMKGKKAAEETIDATLDATVEKMAKVKEED